MIVGVTVLVTAPIALLAWARSPSATGQYAVVEQLVAFSHPLHVNGERIELESLVKAVWVFECQVGFT